MQSLLLQIKQAAAQSLRELFPDSGVQESDILVNETKPEFKGEYTVVLFPFAKLLRQNPEALGNRLGEHLLAGNTLFTAFEVVKGFLNLSLADTCWIPVLNKITSDPEYGRQAASGKKIMVEYSSPNTNKPLHFGHLRNIFLGSAVCEILQTNGHEVIGANLINDRGIHICKSMVAWMHYGNGATPENTGIKGDHLVGDYYVLFNDVYKKQIAGLTATGMTEADAEKQAPLMLEAQELLRKWEDGDPEVRELWQKMNDWVYKGFDESYQRLGVSFDRKYYESETYLSGKTLVQEGLQKKVLFKKEDGSVWVDLRADGLDEKLLLRADGTSVYMTQDLGTAKLKYNDYRMDQSVYVIADEQNYHMQVLQLILKKLGEPCADGIFHLSYGMVELPQGRMKSREGTVVDADDMLDEMFRLAQEQSEQAGKTEGFTKEELDQLYQMIGLAALKFYLLRVEPKKKMIFNPKESIDLHGFTATFIQYAHARICSVLRKQDYTPETARAFTALQETILPLEKSLLIQMEQFPQMLEQAGKDLNPAMICNYTFRLAQTFNSFYDQHSIAHAESEEKKLLRLCIASNTAKVLRLAMAQLKIDVPQKM